MRLPKIKDRKKFFFTLLMIVSSIGLLLSTFMPLLYYAFGGN